jgi:AAA domain/Bifunctional DNA primase/polymerase, N-terminal
MADTVSATNLAAALELAAAGIPIFPAHVVRRFNGWMKKPAIEGWRILASTEATQIERWWQQFPRAVPGIELGQAGLIAIDPDRHGAGPDGMENFAQLCADIGGLSAHPTTDTPSGNHHIFRQNGRTLSNATGALPEGIDVRGAGGWIVAPGSMRSDGTVYTPRPGTPRLAEAYHSGAIPPLPEKLADIIEDSRRPATERTASEADERDDSDGPVDVDASLEAMTYQGGDLSSVNRTLIRVIPSLLRRGEHPDDVLTRVVNAVMEMATRHRLRWSRDAETKLTVKRILSGYRNLLLRGYDSATRELPDWLPGDFHKPWIDALTAGRRPDFGFNRGGFYVRGWQTKDGSQPAQEGEHNGNADERGPQRKAPRAAGIAAKPFERFDPAKLPPREWLYGGHYQRGIITATVGPGGGGKSSLDLVELIAMCTGRNLLGEQPLLRCRAWYHNAEDSRDEIYRRIAAVCQHFKIDQAELEGWLFVTSGIEMPIKIATSRSGKVTIDAVTAEAIIRTIADNEIGVSSFDPLIAHHNSVENATGDMDQIVREFARIANVTDCAIEIVHHTRKPAPGQEELSVIDSRGAGAIINAVRSARVLNTMSRAEADKAGIDDVDRRLHFRIDSGKANMAPPSAARWRKFASVELPNGDNVGVVTPWAYPAAGSADIPDGVCSQIQAEVMRREYKVGAQSPDWVGHLVARTFRLDLSAKAGRAAADRYLAALYTKGVIATGTGETGRHKVRIVVPGAWKPAA